MIKQEQILIGDALMKGCYGTKEYTERSVICLKCTLYNECSKIKREERKPRIR
jgi:hypothetical protein